MIANQPATLTAGETAGNFVVDITSNNGTIDSGFNSVVSLAIVSGPAGGKLVGDGTATARNGVATFGNLQITQQGTYVLEISTDGITAETTPITISPAPASQLEVTVEPGASWQFSAISPAIVVGVTDQFGNLVTAGNPSVTASIASGPPGAVLFGTRTVSAINGFATFSNLSVSLPGIYGLAFASGNNSPAVIENLEIVGIPTRRYLFNGSPLSVLGILMQQRNNAPSAFDFGPPTAMSSPTVIVLSGSNGIAAANFSDELIAGDRLFAVSDAREPAVDPILSSGSDSLQKFLESM